MSEPTSAKPLTSRPITLLLIAVVLYAGLIGSAGLLGFFILGNSSRPVSHRDHTTAQGIALWAPGIAIEGDQKFTSQVRAALELLKAKDPDAYTIIEKNIGRIRQNPRSGMDVFAAPPTFDLSDVSAYSSLEWCAGTIAHDSMHAKQFFDIAVQVGEDKVPAEAWTGTESEKACNAHQLRVLEKIGASRRELDYMAGLDGTHSDVDGDGDYDWDDYKARDW